MNAEIYKGMKLYLTSLTGKKCKYWIFNLLEDKNIIFTTNGDIVEKKNNILLEYCSPDLAIHRIEFKNIEIVKLIKKELNILEDKVIRLNTTQLCSILNKAKDTDEIIYLYEDTDLYIHVNGIKTLVGDIFDNYIAALNILNLNIVLMNMNTDYKDELKLEYDLKKAKYINPFVITDLEILNEKFNKVLIDGLDCVSIKEFTSKLKVEYTLSLLFYVINKKRVEFISIFESDELKVYTFRPHFRLFLLKQKHQ